MRPLIGLVRRIFNTWRCARSASSFLSVTRIIEMSNSQFHKRNVRNRKIRGGRRGDGRSPSFDTLSLVPCSSPLGGTFSKFCNGARCKAAAVRVISRRGNKHLRTRIRRSASADISMRPSRPLRVGRILKEIFRDASPGKGGREREGGGICCTTATRYPAGWRKARKLRQVEMRTGAGQ